MGNRCRRVRRPNLLAIPQKYTPELCAEGILTQLSPQRALPSHNGCYYLVIYTLMQKYLMGYFTSTVITLSVLISGSALALPAFASAATYYVDFATGSDSSNGTSKTTSWKRAPGMQGFTGSYSHQAGDRFIFKGGVTWDSSALPLSIAYNGTAGNVDYYGVDQTWYAGGTWKKPLFDANYADFRRDRHRELLIRYY